MRKTWIGAFVMLCVVSLATVAAAQGRKNNGGPGDAGIQQVCYEECGGGGGGGGGGSCQSGGPCTCTSGSSQLGTSRSCSMCYIDPISKQYWYSGTEYTQRQCNCSTVIITCWRGLGCGQCWR